ncbi:MULTISPECIES: hypothetical protein [Niastella]|uniref:Lipoprotein n=1 Tax=Niastella soli TaxID=2821487 RepID=A0ABS3Z4F2_9BACT|nr:hypothetical protein [Niastella soli]MBO9205042.1 hypothetical protein [Niastella soli]
MKRFLVSVPVMLLAVFIASCGKEKSVEEDVSQYYLKCKIGSVDKTFNFAPGAMKVADPSGAASYSFYGKANNDPADNENLGFSIISTIPLTPGTYKETDPTTDYILGCLYNPNTIEPDKMLASRYDDANPFQVTFTEITTTTISGTFSGKLYLMNSTDPNADSAVISNGQFKLKLQ